MSINIILSLQIDPCHKYTSESMGLEIAAAVFISNQCVDRGKVRSISDKIEVFQAIELAQNHRTLQRQKLKLTQLREGDMESLRDFYLEAVLDECSNFSGERDNLRNKFEESNP